MSEAARQAITDLVWQDVKARLRAPGVEPREIPAMQSGQPGPARRWGLGQLFDAMHAPTGS